LIPFFHSRLLPPPPAGLFLKDGRFKSPVKVYHYLTVYLKPWRWWTSPALKLNAQWHAVRAQGPEPFPYPALYGCLLLCLACLAALPARAPRVHKSCRSLWWEIPLHRCWLLPLVLAVYVRILPLDSHPLAAWGLVTVTLAVAYSLLESLWMGPRVAALFAAFLALLDRPASVFAKLPILLSALFAYCVWIGWEGRGWAAPAAAPSAPKSH